MAHNQRLEWLDIAKGLAIILMVVGHTSIPKTMSNFIFAFHMPLFFFASGLVTNWEKYSVKSFILHRCSSLLLPFIIYSAIVLGVEIIMGIADVHKWLTIGWEGYALWFIPVLFVASVFAKLFTSLFNNKYLFLGGALFIILGAILKYLGVFLPWNLCSVPYASGLILFGSGFKRFKGLIRQPRWWVLIMGFIVTVVVSHFWRLDIAWNSIVPVLPLTIGAIAGTVMTFTLSAYISGLSPKPIKSILGLIGKETYLIMAFSQIIIMALNHYTAIGGITKYLILALILLILKYLKNGVNTLFRCRIL